MQGSTQLAPSRGTLVARTALEGARVHIHDVLSDPEYTWVEGLRIRRISRNARCPLLREGSCLGVMAMSRAVPRPFSDKQIDLVTTFADQAVIAIENVRLFEEVQARTHEVSVALEQQTATAEVLKVISRSAFDLQKVLDTLVESATRLCDADFSLLFMREGEEFRWSTSFGQTADVHERVEAYFKARRISIDRGSITGRAALEAHVVHVSDVLADPDYTWSEAQRISGYRAAIGVPLFREQTVIGVIFVGKGMPQPFTPDQIELVTTFADQAVIAIENARLFDEVQARTEELSESLQQQTATADVLKVISRSAFDLQAVLDTLAESAARLCEADIAAIWRPAEARLQIGCHVRRNL